MQNNTLGIKAENKLQPPQIFEKTSRLNILVFGTCFKVYVT